MADQEMPYFKFVSALIDSGIWAQMSPAARALYPVLLRFSDRNFKPVYPGTLTLLRLTGFKQKSSLRKARKELVSLGLISVTEGTGRKNTYYHFRFDWRDSPPPPRVATRRPAGGYKNDPLGEEQEDPGGSQERPPYNQIHISINNHVPEQEEARKKEKPDQASRDSSKRAFLIRRFGMRNVELAESECNLAGIPTTDQNLEKILYQEAQSDGTSWSEVAGFLSRRISSSSLAAIEQSLLEERGGFLVFSQRLPEHLKAILGQVSKNILFEPEGEEYLSERRQFWYRAGADS